MTNMTTRMVDRFQHVLRSNNLLDKDLRQQWIPSVISILSATTRKATVIAESPKELLSIPSQNGFGSTSVAPSEGSTFCNRDAHSVAAQILDDADVQRNMSYLMQKMNWAPFEVVKNAVALLCRKETSDAGNVNG